MKLTIKYLILNIYEILEIKSWILFQRFFNGGENE